MRLVCGGRSLYSTPSTLSSAGVATVRNRSTPPDHLIPVNHPRPSLHSAARASALRQRGAASTTTGASLSTPRFRPPFCASFNSAPQRLGRLPFREGRGFYNQRRVLVNHSSEVLISADLGRSAGALWLTCFPFEGARLVHPAVLCVNPKIEALLEAPRRSSPRGAACTVRAVHRQPGFAAAFFPV